MNATLDVVLPKPIPSFLKALFESTKLPGEVLTGSFAQEFRKLTPDDKHQLSAYMTASNIEHEPPKL